MGPGKQDLLKSPHQTWGSKVYLPLPITLPVYLTPGKQDLPANLHRIWEARFTSQSTSDLGSKVPTFSFHTNSSYYTRKARFTCQSTSRNGSEKQDLSSLLISTHQTWDTFHNPHQTTLTETRTLNHNGNASLYIRVHFPLYAFSINLFNYTLPLWCSFIFTLSS